MKPAPTSLVICAPLREKETPVEVSNESFAPIEVHAGAGFQPAPTATDADHVVALRSEHAGRISRRSLNIDRLLGGHKACGHQDHSARAPIDDPAAAVAETCFGAYGARKDAHGRVDERAPPYEHGGQNRRLQRYAVLLVHELRKDRDVHHHPLWIEERRQKALLQLVFDALPRHRGRVELNAERMSLLAR